MSGSLALALSVLYVLGFAILVRRLRSTGGLVPLTLPPLLLTTFASWLVYARVATMLSPDPEAAAEAGLVLAPWVLGVGGIMTIVCAVIARFAVRADVVSARRPPITVPALCWLMSAAAVTATPVFTTRRGFAAWNAALIAAFLTLVLLVALAVAAAVANRYAVSRRNQFAALGITAMLASIQIAVAWYFFARIES